MKKRKIIGIMAVLLCIVWLLLWLSVRISAQEAPMEAGVSDMPKESPTAEIPLDDWKELITNKVIPIVVFAITAIGGVYVAIAPVLNNMRNASGNMEKSTGGINHAADASRQAVEKIDAFRADIEKSMQEFSVLIEKILAENQDNFRAISALTEQKVEDMRERLEQMKSEMGNMEAMLTVGFGNSDELVRKGYAKVIFDLNNGTVDVSHGVIDIPPENKELLPPEETGTEETADERKN